MSNLNVCKWLGGGQVGGMSPAEGTQLRSNTILEKGIRADDRLKNFWKSKIDQHNELDRRVAIPYQKNQETKEASVQFHKVSLGYCECIHH